MTGTPYFAGTPGPVSRPLSFPSGPDDALAEGEGTLAASGTVSAPEVGLPYQAGITGPLPGVFTWPAGQEAAPTGAGTITATAVETLTGGAALTGTGTLAAEGGTPVQATAAMAGAGRVSAIGTSSTPVTFMIAAACGDSAASPVSVTAPSGWTALHTVTATGGSDGTSDCVLAAACGISATTVTAHGVASSAQAISGMITGVLQSAPSPVPTGLNEAWPYVVVEAGFGAGFMTPPDEITWTNIQTLANGKRMRGWDEQIGVQYELAALEASEATGIMDNPDGALSPFNPASPWFPDVVPGTPIRIRAVPPASTGTDAWQVLWRNMERWPQTWDDTYRGLSEADITDIWSVINRSLPSPYRAEIEADEPGWWYPCDDQPGAGGVQPLQLRNAAQGSTNPLTIAVSPNGTYFLNAIQEWPYLATSSVAQDSGWMYGDPSTPAGPGGPGGPTTAQPGAFSWQHSGNGGLTTGFWLTVNDSFPSLTGGVTIENWAKYDFANSTSTTNTGAIVALQPAGSLVIWSIASDTAPVATLYLDTSGHLQFTAGGSTTPVYTGSDLRSEAWHHYAVTMTASSWTVWVDAGATARVSGGGSLTPGWTWLNVGAGMGSGGGGATSSVTGTGDASHSHITVYPRVLPPARIISHYVAATTGFGAVPAPASPQVQYVPAGSMLPNGTFSNGGYGDGAPSTLAFTATASVGPMTSGPCAEQASVNANTAGSLTGGDYYLNWAGVGTGWDVYTASQTRAELHRAAVTGPWSDQTGGGYGSGASPPAAPTGAGDTVAQRIERLLSSGLVSNPQRAIDPAADLVQAALDTGGQSCGTAITNIVQSDGGLMFIDNNNTVCYSGRPRLGSQQVAWALGPDVAAGQIPYQNDDASLDTDPQRIWNDVSITPYSPDGSSLPLIRPTDTATADASQQQFGDSQQQITSYLQDQTVMQAQADWTLANYAEARQRVTSLTVNAAGMTDSCPAAWIFVFGVNVGDLIQVTVMQPGQPQILGTFRATKVHRTINFAQGVASANVICDYLPPSYY